MQARRHRRPLSLLGAVLYALFAIALPSLHLGLHRADHEHRDGGLQRLHTGLGGHPSLALDLLPHSHGTSFHNEADDDRERPDVGASASPKSSGQISLHAAQLQPASWLFALQEPSPQSAAPRFTLLGTERHAPGGSTAADPEHGSCSLAHFASAFIGAAFSISLPLAGLLCEQTRYIPRADCAPPSPVLSAKHARGPPAPVAAI
jgi:hypothetical protein